MKIIFHPDFHSGSYIASLKLPKGLRMTRHERDDAPPVYRDGDQLYYPDNSMPVVRAARAKRSP